MKLWLVFILLFIIGCATGLESLKNLEYTDRSSGHINTIELEGWGRITFVDKLINPQGKKCAGTYQEVDGLHRIKLNRNCNIEKFLIHEWMHSEGWHHRTKEEEKVFYGKLAEYGPFKTKRKR